MIQIVACQGTKAQRMKDEGDRAMIVRKKDIPNRSIEEGRCCWKIRPFSSERLNWLIESILETPFIGILLLDAIPLTE